MKMQNIINSLLVIKCILISTTIYTTEFNSKDYPFLRISDIKEWMPLKFQKDKILKKMQDFIFEEMSNNLAILSVHLPILKSVATSIAQSKELNILIISSDSGIFAYKLACALGETGTLIINSSYRDEVERAKALFKKRKKYIPLSKKNIIFDAEDTTHLLEKYPVLEGKFDLIYIQDVEHIMNPVQHQAFVTTILKLLASGGQVCSVARTIPEDYNVKGNLFFETYRQLKKEKVVYPLFLKHTKTAYRMLAYSNREAFLPGGVCLKDVKHPDERTMCLSTILYYDNIEEKEYNKSLIPCQKVKIISLLNYFTPTIYINAYREAAQNLDIHIKKENDGYITVDGNFLHKYSNNKQIVFTMVNIQKI